jgi:uncharacterized protein (TIGR02594 family)
MNQDIIKAFQQRLADLGWYTGPIDGDAGTGTQNAVAAFKAASAMNPRKYVGVVTMQALFDDAAIRAKKPEPTKTVLGTSAVWMSYARTKEGLKEFAGAPSNPVLLQWAKELGLSAVYVNDGVSWCGLFVAHVMSHVVPADPLPKNPLGARAWLNYGVACEPGYGAILVFWRGTKSGWQGHVGFYVGEDANYYYVFGGNQSDSVNVTKVAKGRLLGARAPKSVPFTPATVRMTTSGKVSTNEA